MKKKGSKIKAASKDRKTAPAKKARAAKAKPAPDLQKAIDRERAKRERWLDAVGEGEMTLDQFRPRRAASEQREAALVERLEAERDKSAAFANVESIAARFDLARDFARLWSAGNAEEKRRILGVVWETSGARRSRLDTARRSVDPAWRPVWRAMLAVEAYPARG